MRKLNQKGFTLIELIMVILLVAILAAVAIPQFIDFRAEARSAAASSALGAMRTAIAMQKGQMLLRCNAPANAWPDLASVNGNNIELDATCAPFAAQVPDDQRAFVPPQLPDNPFSAAAPGNAARRGVAAGTSIVAGMRCNGTTPVDGTEDGWCYNASTGEIWPATGQLL